MSKELPYFKFYVNEWITGDITLEDFDVQGVFINICAYYWSKGCVCTFSQLKKRFRTVDDKTYQILIDSKIMKVDKSDNVIINFLIEQTEDRISKSETNTKNGKKGGRPPKTIEPPQKENPKETEIKPNENPKETEDEANCKAKKTNIEEIREEEIREDNIIIEDVKNDDFSFSEHTVRIQYDKFLKTDSVQKDQMAMNNQMTKRQIDVACIGFVTSLLESGELEMKSIYPKFGYHFRNWFNKFGKDNLSAVPKAKIEVEFNKFKIHEFKEKELI